MYDGRNITTTGLLMHHAGCMMHQQSGSCNVTSVIHAAVYAGVFKLPDRGDGIAFVRWAVFL